jgi:hypothetical protein
MTTGATPGAAMDPLAFLTTPRETGALTPSLFSGKAVTPGMSGTPEAEGSRK